MRICETGERRERFLDDRNGRGARIFRRSRPAEFALVLAFRADGNDRRRQADGNSRGRYRRRLQQRGEKDQYGGHPRQHDFRVSDGT